VLALRSTLQRGTAIKQLITVAVLVVSRHRKGQKQPADRIEPRTAGRAVFPFRQPLDHQQQQQQNKMGKAKKTRKFAEVKRMLNPKDMQ
jgi:hypothetical protein